jgi:hypothetical protein
MFPVSSACGASRTAAPHTASTADAPSNPPSAAVHARHAALRARPATAAVAHGICKQTRLPPEVSKRIIQIRFEKHIEETRETIRLSLQALEESDFPVDLIKLIKAEVQIMVPDLHQDAFDYLEAAIQKVAHKHPKMHIPYLEGIKNWNEADAQTVPKGKTHFETLLLFCEAAKIVQSKIQATDWVCLEKYAAKYSHTIMRGDYEGTDHKGNPEPSFPSAAVVAELAVRSAKSKVLTSICGAVAKEYIDSSRSDAKLIKQLLGEIAMNCLDKCSHDGVINDAGICADNAFKNMLDTGYLSIALPFLVNEALLVSNASPAVASIVKYSISAAECRMFISHDLGFSGLSDGICGGVFTDDDQDDLSIAIEPYDCALKLLVNAAASTEVANATKAQAALRQPDALARALLAVFDPVEFEKMPELGHPNFEQMITVWRVRRQEREAAFPQQMADLEAMFKKLGL